MDGDLGKMRAMHEPDSRAGAPAEPPGPDSEEASARSSRRARRAWWILAGAYLLAILVLAATGHFAFFWKTAAAPGVLLLVVASGRFGRFVRDWAILLAGILVFDSFRGAIFAAIDAFDLPFYMGYVIEAERLLFGGATLPDLLQAVLLHSRGIGTLELALVVVHASHFLVFFFFAFWIWMDRSRTDFARFSRALLLMMYLGLLGYLLVPTVPPWMASGVFGMLPEIDHVTSQVYDLRIPTLQSAFDTNPIAAMPSLHAAFPSLLFLFTVRWYRSKSWGFGAYLVAVYFAIIYLGEHYFLDVAAGFALALGCYVWTLRRPVSGREISLRVAVAILAVALLVSQLLGVWSTSVGPTVKPTPDFVEREFPDGMFEGIQSWVTGYRAYLRKDWVEAERRLLDAVPRLEGNGFQDEALVHLGRSAARNGDWPMVQRAFESLTLEVLAPHDGVQLAVALDRLGAVGRARETLDRLLEIHGEDPDAVRIIESFETELDRRASPMAGDLPEP